MIIEPSIFSHPKFLLFKQALGDGRAFEFLCRIWAHCQVSKKGQDWGKVSPEYVEAVAAWDGEPGRLYKELASRRLGCLAWIELEPDGSLTIVGWNEHNASYVANWRNGSKGGRPPKTQQNQQKPLPTENPPKTHGLATEKPDDNPKETQTGVGVTNCSTLLPSTLLPSTLGGLGEKNAAWPTLEEFLQSARMANLPEHVATEEWHYQEKLPRPWGNVGNWQKHLRHIKVKWEQHGSPGPGRSAGAAIGLDKVIAQISDAIANHPANRASAAYKPSVGEEEKLHLKKLRARLNELRAQRCAT